MAGIDAQDAASLFDREELADAEANSETVVTRPPPRPSQLGYFSVFCIIVDRTIGTGIFQTPSTIRRNTQSVGATLLLWFLGAIATFAGSLCFTEFGLTVPRWELNGEEIYTPRSGGELNYLNYLLKRPSFLATCMYGVGFIIVGNASANSLAFASFFLRAVGYSDSMQNSARLIAIGTITVVCLLHGMWRRLGIIVNNIFALTKILILVMIIIIGFASIGGEVFHTEPPAAANLDPHHSFSGAQNAAYGYAEAYLNVVYACAGFNQASYVLGEIRDPRRTFRPATLFAVGTVLILYMLVNIAYMIVVPAQTQASDSVPEQFIRLTLGRVSSYGDQNATQIINALMAISSFGNIVVFTYTSTRVKQEIAKEGILPFSRFFARNYGGIMRIFSRVRKSNENDQERTPLGALLLHWFCCVLLISCTWGADSITDAYNIIGGVYSYVVYAFFGVFIGVGLLVLRLKRGSNWHLKSSSNAIISICSATVYAIAMAFPLIVLWISPTGGSTTSFPWFLVPTASILVLSLGILYWVGFTWGLPRVGKYAGRVLRTERVALFHRENGDLVQAAEIVTYNWVINS